MMSNALAQELLEDVHRICSAHTDTHDFTQLAHYLLHQRGAAILAQLDTIPLQVSGG